MGNSGLYYYKLVSPYSDDITKNCKLTINEIDHNFKTLKDMDIKSAEFIRESKTLVLTRNNGEMLIVPLNDITYNLNVETEYSDSGNSITISYDGENGKKTIVFDGLVTVDNLMSIIGSDILTKVITDGTLRGYGTIDHPLGINSVEKTGMMSPAKAKIDLTSGGRLPEVAKLGTRYVTVENVNDYGYLYNGLGLNKIIANVEAEGKGWRVPTKADWDVLLNWMEPCEYQNHNSSRCHVELGKLAGKYLKSECGWLGQAECECTVTKPLTGCSSIDDYVSGSSEDSGIPTENPISPSSVDKFGMTVLPSGVVTLDAYGRPQANAFKEHALYWTTTHVHGDVDQDVYVKDFVFNKGGVYQSAECPTPFYSVRLVKDYDGSNYFDTEYIDGVVYKTILFPETGQIWLASNYAKKEGFVMAKGEGEIAEIAEVNNGEIIENRTALFLNEWNGNYWEKKQLKEGDSIVIENPPHDGTSDIEIEYCWKIDETGEEQCDTIVIETEAQHNVEYRVFTVDGCNQDLVNSDNLVVERVINAILPVIIREKEERISADTELWEAIEEETQERISADTELWNAIEDEAQERISADTELWNAIEDEAQERISADTEINERIDEIIIESESAITELREALDSEIERATSAETAISNELAQEVERATTQEQILNEKIEAESARAKEEEEFLDDKIDDESARATEREDEIEEEVLEEIERAKAREDEIDGQLIDSSIDYSMSVAPQYSTSEEHPSSTRNPNLTLKSKDGNDEHSIKIEFDGNFGEI